MESKAAAVWSGDFGGGQGNLSSGSEVLDGLPLAPSLQSESVRATNPEELLAAAHASCFSLTLAMILGKQNLPASKIDTEATVTLDKTETGPAITKMRLMVRAIVPIATPDQFIEAAKEAEKTCPVSKLINAEITMEALLMDIG